MMLAAALVTPTVIDKMANSSNPWIYLAGILLVLITILLKKAYTYFVTREERLFKLDEDHRKDSKEREQKLNEQLDQSIAANLSLSETQREIVAAINNMGATVNDVKTDVRDLRTRVEAFEKKESA